MFAAGVLLMTIPFVLVHGDLMIRNYGIKTFTESRTHITSAEALVEALRNNPSAVEVTVYGGAVGTLGKGSISGLQHFRFLTIIMGGLAVIEPGAFHDLPSLENLMLPQNDMTTLRSGCFANLTVATIYLARNKISVVEDGAFRLQCWVTLKLLENELMTLRSGCFANLSVATINLARNKISLVENGAFRDLPELTFVDLQKNELRSWDGRGFENVPKMLGLNLEFNGLESVHDSAFDHMKTLEKVQLGRNKLTRIGPVFAELPYLKEVNLAMNGFVELPEDLFRPTAKKLEGYALVFMVKRALTFLNLHHNNLTCLPDRLLEDLVHTQHIGIEMNPWSCPCYFRVMNWARRNKVRVNQRHPLCGHPNYPVCVVPVNGGNLTTSDLDHYTSTLQSSFNRKRPSPCVNGYRRVHYMNRECEFEPYPTRCTT